MRREPLPAWIPQLGPRGEGWVVVQALLIAAIGLSAVWGREWPDALRVPAYAVGGALLAAGALLLVAGGLHLGSALTPLPAPRGDELTTGGLYARVRHPMYGGGILAALGWSIVFGSLAAAALTAALGVFAELKSRREEHWLEERHPEYGEYRRATPRKFVPFVW